MEDNNIFQRIRIAIKLSRCKRLVAKNAKLFAKIKKDKDFYTDDFYDVFDKE